MPTEKQEALAATLLATGDGNRAVKTVYGNSARFERADALLTATGMVEAIIPALTAGGMTVDRVASVLFEATTATTWTYASLPIVRPDGEPVLDDYGRPRMERVLAEVPDHMTRFKAAKGVLEFLAAMNRARQKERELEARQEVPLTAEEIQRMTPAELSKTLQERMRG